MVIIGHRSFKSTIGANSIIVKCMISSKYSLLFKEITISKKRLQERRRGERKMVHCTQRHSLQMHLFCLVEVTEFNLGQDSKARLGQDFKFKFCRDADVWLRF